MDYEAKFTEAKHAKWALSHPLLDLRHKSSNQRHGSTAENRIFGRVLKMNKKNEF